MSIVTRTTAKTYFETNDVPTQAQFSDTLDSLQFKNEETDPILKAFAALGSSVKGHTLGARTIGNGTANMADGSLYFIPVWLAIDGTAVITGVKFWSSSAGNFTADNTNSIALFTYSAGTLTKQAESANDGNIWKGTTNSWQTVAFSATYTASAGLHYVGLLYNSSAQTTAVGLATIGISIPNAPINSLDFTNSALLFAVNTAQGSMPATQLMSGLTGHTQPLFYVALY